MRAAQITPQKIKNIIEGAKAAGRTVDSFEIDGMVVNLSSDGNDTPKKGLGEKKWSRS